MNRRNFLGRAAMAYSALILNRRSFAVPTTQSALPAVLQQKLMHDPLRPQFHLLPRAHWMNDPCAPRFFGGQYHMFFQYNPGAAVWGDMHWAHAVSPDLIHWKHLPIALSPTPGSSDALGCWTGSVLPGAEVPTILYTGVTKTSPEHETIRGQSIREVVCLATSDDPDLRTWEKLDRPILEGPPPGLHVTGFRDPCPWKEGDTWYLAIGSGFDKVGGAVLLYTSRDARHWTYLHPLAQGKWSEGTETNPVFSGEMWECPDFFPLGEKHVLLYSSEHKVHWHVGSFDHRDLRFHLETAGVLDHGSYYAMKSMLDAHGRRILWGWVEETRSPEECTAAGWAGAMALPRVLSLGPDNQLRMDVPPEFASLRNHTQINKVLQSTATLEVQLNRASKQNRAGEIVCTLKAAQGDWRLELLTGATKLFAIYSEDSKSSVIVGGKTLALSPDHEGVSTVRVWIDGSIIETLVDSKEAMTARCYAPSPDDIRVKCSGAPGVLQSLTVSGVTPISNDRLTS